MRLSMGQVRNYARVGAERRLTEIQTERESILSEFPELRRAAENRRTARKGGRPRGFKMTDEAKAKIAAAARKRWAARRKAAAK